MTTTITIVGATGNTGIPLLYLLARHPSRYTVRACTRDPAKATETYAGQLPNVTFVAVDAEGDDSQLLDAALQGSDELVLLKPFFPDYGKVYCTKWVAAVKRMGTVKRIHLLSGLGGLGMLRGTSPTAKVVLDAETPIIESGLDYTIMRPPFFHTNARAWAREIRTKGTLSMPWGYRRFCAIGTDDIAAAFFQVIKDGPGKHKNAIFHLTTNELLDGPKIAAAFSRALDRPIQYQSVNVEEYIKLQGELGIPEPVARFSAGLMQMTLLGEFEFTMTDLKTLTGRDGVSFEQWAFENVEPFRERN
ncbi:hypothetical protein HDV00_003949 [Rhizophlyctis rosea]|nr:hypothetical protein HDV00_003949 [Rhizophlyctis rosea]